jgi:hypothetical protein
VFLGVPASVQMQMSDLAVALPAEPAREAPLCGCN